MRLSIRKLVKIILVFPITVQATIVENCFWSKSIDLSEQVVRNYKENSEASDINVAVRDLLEADLISRQEILEYKLPEDFSGKEYIEKADEIDSLPYMRQIKCFLSGYEKGDEVRKFSVINKSKQEEGFIIVRSGEIKTMVFLLAKYN